MNKHFIFAYILTAVFLFSIAGVIVYQQRQINSLISQSSTKKATGILIIPSTSPKASPAPMLDPMSQWKTYTNTKDGYSIRYPKSWTLYNTPVESGTPTIESDIESWAVSGAENVSSINYSISFEVIPNNFDTWLINQGKDFKDHFKYSKSVINGYNAYTTTSLPDMLNNLSILIENKNILIKITLTPYDPAKSSEIPVKHIFDQILSTFKFTQ